MLITLLFISPVWLSPVRYGETMAVAIRAALMRLGFTRAAATTITDVQGYDSLDELAELDDDEVKSLCKVLRRPGGTINAPGRGGGNVPNPGTVVSLKAENNLILGCYFLRFKKRTSRQLNANDVTAASVRALKPLKDWESSHKDVQAPEIDAKDWPRTIEALEEWLRGCLGVTKIPLAYVIRDNVVPAAQDPPGGFSTKQAELIARAPIQQVGVVPPTNDSTFDSDNAKVWELISNITRDHECWSYVRPAQRRRDGRAAFLGLKNHYLGEHNVDNMSSKAERKLRNIAYTGEKRRFNFERFVKVHVDQHAILEGLVEHGYSGIDARSKVRHLLDGIKTTELDTVKTRIMSDAVLRSDFDRCVNLFQDFIEQKRGSANVERDVQIAAVKTKHPAKRERDLSNVAADMTVEDRYYKKSEYMALSDSQKMGLKLKREKRGGGGPSGRKRNNSGGKEKVNLSSRTIKAIAQAMKDDATEPTSPIVESESESDDEVPMKEPKKAKLTTNRSNPALQRKRIVP